MLVNCRTCLPSTTWNYRIVLVCVSVARLLFYQWAYSTCLSVDIISHHHVCEPLLSVVYQFMQSHYLYICVCLLLQPTPLVSLMYIMHDGYTILTLATNATDVGMPINILRCPFISRKNDYVLPRGHISHKRPGPFDFNGGLFAECQQTMAHFPRMMLPAGL